MDKEKFPDVKELKEIMETLNETVPSLIRNIIGSLYDVKGSERLAEETADFYKKLIDAGMDEGQAYELTKDFMKGRDVGSLVKEVVSSMGDMRKFRGGFGEEVEKEVSENVERELEGSKEEGED